MACSASGCVEWVVEVEDGRLPTILPVRYVPQSQRDVPLLHRASSVRHLELPGCTKVARREIARVSHGSGRGIDAVPRRSREGANSPHHQGTLGNEKCLAGMPWVGTRVSGTLVLGSDGRPGRGTPTLTSQRASTSRSTFSPRPAGISTLQAEARKASLI